MTTETVSAGSNSEEPFRKLNLQDAIRALRRDLAVQPGKGRTMQMLIRRPGVRIGVVALQRGCKWEEHKTESRVSIHTIEGRVRLELRERCLELSAGDLLVLEPGIPHNLEALEDAALLLTLY